MKSKGILSSAINSHLLTLIEENDRRNDVFSPSLIAGGCLIALILDKIGYRKASRLPDPQTKRIFANGSDVHTRLQQWAKDSGISKFQEVALKHPSCGMYGTTDEVLYLDKNDEVVIADYKSIKQEKYEKDLKAGALEGNINQANMYVGMIELRRKHLQKQYKTLQDLYDDTANRIRYYREEYFDHIKSGRKFSRGQKLRHLIGLALKVDAFLWTVKTPVTRFSILYENKNTQAFKEFEYRFDQAKFDAFVEMCFKASDWLAKHDKVDQDNIEYFQRTKKILPKRDAKFDIKSPPCQWCGFKDLCYTFIESEGQNETKDKTKAKDKNKAGKIFSSVRKGK